MTDNVGKISITRQDWNENNGRYVATIAGKEGEAELTFVYQDGMVYASHTEAPLELRGTGAAPALVKRLVEDMRKENKKIVPLCSYVAVQLKRHPEWADISADWG